jgi:hypothetical protein
MSEPSSNRRWSVIAEGMARLERESIERAARASPGENIEAALALSSLVLRSQSDFERPAPVSLVALWKARRREP